MDEAVFGLLCGAVAASLVLGFLGVTIGYGERNTKVAEVGTRLIVGTLVFVALFVLVATLTGMKVE
jgi:hypothetical protein